MIFSISLTFSEELLFSAFQNLRSHLTKKKKNVVGLGLSSRLSLSVILSFSFKNKLCFLFVILLMDVWRIMLNSMLRTPKSDNSGVDTSVTNGYQHFLLMEKWAYNFKGCCQFGIGENGCGATPLRALKWSSGWSFRGEPPRLSCAVPFHLPRLPSCSRPQRRYTRVHGESLQGVIKACYSIAPNKKSPINQHKISISLRRMEIDPIETPPGFGGYTITKATSNKNRLETSSCEAFAIAESRFPGGQLSRSSVSCKMILQKRGSYTCKHEQNGAADSLRTRSDSDKKTSKYGSVKNNVVAVKVSNRACNSAKTSGMAKLSDRVKGKAKQ
ncbi:hypothetical protein VNO77_19463 [Canavalia gladiata]|uniref:Uncharacterized protein n=1 Tax=Canavalia gladiata TaxID=3824 RepID=A0AAN9LNE9_CANGL